MEEEDGGSPVTPQERESDGRGTTLQSPAPHTLTVHPDTWKSIMLLMCLINRFECVLFLMTCDHCFICIQ